MDYEKKYKEALEAIKDYYSRTKYSSFCDARQERKVLEQAFPELTESEDEKIKQEIIDFIFDKTDTYELREKSNAWLAWLEKQRQVKEVESKSIEWKQENVDELSKFEHAMMHIGGSFFGNNAGLDPNDTAAIKEQAKLLSELAPKQELNEEGELIQLAIKEVTKSKEDAIKFLENAGIVSVVNGKAELAEPYRSEKKPTEWSEEDKDFMNDTLSNLTELKDRYGEGYGNVGKCIDWIKSLSDRVQPQPKQAWSEEDEKMTEAAIQFAHKYGRHGLWCWLKSLKERLFH